MRPAALIALAALGLGCARSLEVTLPPVVSAPPAPDPSGTLRAGFGRADLTPPPGLPLAGNGFEGRQARGWRHRLYVRALVLEDARGERLAIAVADLPHVSPLLQRFAAQRLRRRTGIGADRLILSATHTHSAPASFYEARSYNEQSAALPGFDSAWTEVVVAGIAQAVEDAAHALVPARVGWAIDTVPAAARLVRNRSIEAFLLNPDRLTATRSTDTAALRFEATDRTWTLLRVDRCDGPCRPWGAFSIFAIHGTGNPPANDLADGDIHAIVERRLERHVERLAGLVPSDPGACPPVTDGAASTAGAGCAFRSAAFHLFANGAEGDVSPFHDAGTRCGEEEPDRKPGEVRLAFRAGRRPGGPRAPLPPEEWRFPSLAAVEGCRERARLSAERIGGALGDFAEGLFDRAGFELSHNVTLARAFVTLDTQRPDAPDTLCPPASGTANFGGAEDGRTRLFRWRFFGLIPSGIEEGGAAAKPRPSGCHGAKQIGLGPFQALFTGRGGLPTVLQLGAYRVGDVVLGAVPGEVTTEGGMRIKAALARAGTGASHAAIIGLANGYVQYIPTAEEYAWQAYEGGSGLYGPNTAAVVTGVLERLARSLADGTPLVMVDSIPAWLGAAHSYLPAARISPAPPRAILSASCRDGVFRAEWLDEPPGNLLPAPGPVLQIQRREADGRWQPLAWDDDRSVEVRVLGPAGRLHRWEVRWHLPRGSREADYRLVLEARRAPAGVSRLAAEGNQLVHCETSAP
jgi:hypothetical protein